MAMVQRLHFTFKIVDHASIVFCHARSIALKYSKKTYNRWHLIFNFNFEKFIFLSNFKFWIIFFVHIFTFQINNINLYTMNFQILKNLNWLLANWKFENHLEHTAFTQPFTNLITFRHNYSLPIAHHCYSISIFTLNKSSSIPYFNFHSSDKRCTNINLKFLLF